VSYFRQEISYITPTGHELSGRCRRSLHESQVHPAFWANIERPVLGSLSEVPPAIPISAPSSSDIHDEIDGEEEPEAAFDVLVLETSLDDPNVTLLMNAVGVTASRSIQYCNYIYRSLSEPFNSQSLYEFLDHCKVTKKRDDRGNAGMADGNADVNGESEVGSDVDAATDGIIPSQSHRQPRLLGATSRMSTIRRRHVFWYSSHPLWCLLFLDLLSLTQKRAMRPKSRGTRG